MSETVNRRDFTGMLALGAGGILLPAAGYAAAPARVAIKNVVLVHGLFADGSSWLRVIPFLQAAGLAVTSVQNPLTTLEDAVAATSKVLARQDGPVVLVGHSFLGMKHVLAYLARYTHRVAIANSRLVSVDATRVTFRWRDYRRRNAARLRSLAPDECIRRFLIHSLPDGFHRIRHYGFLANGCCRARLETIRQLLPASEAAREPAVSPPPPRRRSGYSAIRPSAHAAVAPCASSPFCPVFGTARRQPAQTLISRSPPGSEALAEASGPTAASVDPWPQARTAYQRALPRRLLHATTLEMRLVAHLRRSQRTNLINQLRAILLERGEIFPAGRRKLELGLEDLLAEDRGTLSPRVRQLVVELRAEWNELDAKIEV